MSCNELSGMQEYLFTSVWQLPCLNATFCGRLLLHSDKVEGSFMKLIPEKWKALMNYQFGIAYFICVYDKDTGFLALQV